MNLRKRNLFSWIGSLAICALLMGNSCKRGSEQTNESQGIQGTVKWYGGNRMPSITGNAQGQGSPIARELHIYAITSSGKAQMAEQFYTRVDTKLVKVGKANEQGEFKIGLPPGRYSVFTKEEKGLYANMFDGENNIQPVEVKKGAFTDMDIRVDYEAVY